MGVVYKLKKELIDYIVDQKRQNPRLSCRALVDVVKERFNLEVSKSAINALLKEAQLSSPIGRRPKADKKAAKFKLPDFRKKQLFEERQNLLSDEGDSQREPHEDKKKKSIQEEKMSKQEATFEKDRPGVSLDKKEKKKTLKETESFVSLDLEEGEIESLSQRDFSGQGRSLELGPLCDGMGCFFLKAAEWELCGAPLLGKALAPLAKGYLLKDVNPASEVLLFAKAFGLTRQEDFEAYGGQGLWALNNIKGKIESDFLQKIMLSVEDPGMLSLRISADFPQLVAQACCFKVRLEDGGQFYVDGRFKTLGAEPHLEGEQVAVNKCLFEISETLIANTRPFVIRQIPGQEAFSKPFFDMLGAFEKAQRMGLSEVSVLDSQGQEMASFSLIPNKKRTFIAGGALSQKEGRMLAEKSPELVKICYLSPLDREILFSEMKARLTVREKACPMRVALIRDKDSRKPTEVILTNISEHEMPIEKVLSLYFARWPGGARRPGAASERPAAAVAHSGGVGAGRGHARLQPGPPAARPAAGQRPRPHHRRRYVFH